MDDIFGNDEPQIASNPPYPTPITYAQTEAPASVTSDYVNLAGFVQQASPPSDPEPISEPPPAALPSSPTPVRKETDFTGAFCLSIDPGSFRSEYINLANYVQQGTAPEEKPTPQPSKGSFSNTLDGSGLSPSPLNPAGSVNLPQSTPKQAQISIPSEPSSQYTNLAAIVPKAAPSPSSVPDTTPPQSTPAQNAYINPTLQPKTSGPSNNSSKIVTKIWLANDQGKVDVSPSLMPDIQVDCHCT